MNRFDLVLIKTLVELPINDESIYDTLLTKSNKKLKLALQLAHIKRHKINFKFWVPKHLKLNAVK